MIKLKRVYDPPERKDGARFLVERLWPRGVRKSDLPLNAWLKDVAPSTELRRWFAHDPEKWSEFRRWYVVELQRNARAVEPLLGEVRKQPTTLIYSAHDREHNAAIVLRDFLMRKLRHG
jgi:uncharacterized protein YeaO (DUF488 family)